MLRSKLSQIRTLQALSTFFVGEQAPTPGATYPFVAIRCLAHFLDVDPGSLRLTLEPLAAQGFCELTRYEARLTPSRWNVNDSRRASFLAFFVANAPAALRGAFAQLPVDPRRCFNPQPQVEGKNATIASNFNGVYSSSQYRENCEPPDDKGPFELEPPYHGSSQPELTVADNLAFLSFAGVLFRAFLASAWLQGVASQTAYGRVTVLLADYPQEAPCLVAAPCDGLWLAFQATATTWTPASFVAQLTGQTLQFTDPGTFPRYFTSLSGGTIALFFNGTATVTNSGDEAALSLTAFFQVVGPCSGGSFLLSLVPVGASQLSPSLAAPVR